MANTIYVSTQILVDAAKKVRDINQVLDEKLKAINKTMNDLEDSYKSDSGEKIRADMNALKPHFEQYKDVIESYAKFLDDTAKIYEEIEIMLEENASAFD